MRSGIKNTLKILFAIYLLLLLYLLFFQRIGHLGSFENYTEHLKNAVSLEPFRSTGNSLKLIRSRGLEHPLSRIELRNLLGNVFLLLPYGIFLPVLRKSQRNFPVFLLCTVLLICAAELIQLFSTLGVCDVDDLILNTAGAVFGWLIWLAGHHLSLNKKAK